MLFVDGGGRGGGTGFAVSALGFRQNQNRVFEFAIRCGSLFSGLFSEMCASTTSTANTSSQILFSVLMEVYFGFAVFFYYLCGFTVTYILQCPPEGRVISRQVEYGTNKERKVGF